MTTATVLDPVTLEDWVPHRGANLIPDQVTLSADMNCAVAEVRILPGDDRGREIFGRRDGAGRAVWNEPFLAELLALAGVPLLTPRLAAQGQVSVFSALSRVELGRPVGLDEPLAAQARIVRDRTGFTQFEARLHAGDELIFAGDIMSGAATMAAICAGQVRPPADGAQESLQADFGWKPTSQRYVDAVQRWDEAARAVTCTYCYPEDHPFVPSHFPGAPLMMGVTQWMAVADALWEAGVRSGAVGTISGEGRVLRPDGAEVMTVRGLLLDASDGVPRIAACKRVAFREPVLPGDGLWVEAAVTDAARGD